MKRRPDSSLTGPTSNTTLSWGESSCFNSQLGIFRILSPTKTIPVQYLSLAIIPFVEKLTSGSSLKLSLFIAVFVSYSKAKMLMFDHVSTISCTCKNIIQALCPWSGGRKWRMFSYDFDFICPLYGTVITSFRFSSKKEILTGTDKHLFVCSEKALVRSFKPFVR